jgi:hypothetical protein
MDVIMDYHLIFVIVSLALYLAVLVLIFAKPDKEQLILAIVLGASNIPILYMASLGFFRIGLVGIDLVTGDATVTGYEEMYEFYMVFFALLMIDIAMMGYAFLNVMKLGFLENMSKNRKPLWRESNR